MRTSVTMRNKMKETIEWMMQRTELQLMKKTRRLLRTESQESTLGRERDAQG